jgi:hypothetical protein
VFGFLHHENCDAAYQHSMPDFCADVCLNCNIQHSVHAMVKTVQIGVHSSVVKLFHELPTLVPQNIFAAYKQSCIWQFFDQTFWGIQWAQVIIQQWVTVLIQVLPVGYA